MCQDTNWKSFMENLMDQPYVMVQTYNEFATLDLDTKRMFCRVRIKKLLENVGDRFRNFLVDSLSYGLNSLIVDVVQEVGNGVGTPFSCLGENSS